MEPRHRRHQADGRRAEAHHRQLALSTTGINAMLTQATSAPGMVINAALLDADPYALCTPDGMVDLRTGLVKAPDPPRTSTHGPPPSDPRTMPTPRWERFLADAFGEDAEAQHMVSDFQLLLGYSVTGDVGGQVPPLLFDSGTIGKSVLLDVLMRLLGDYADAAPLGFSWHALHGRRAIFCSEVKHGDKYTERSTTWQTPSSPRKDPVRSRYYAGRSESGRNSIERSESAEGRPHPDERSEHDHTGRSSSAG
nr:hypothetical protein [Streptomyces ambofaciens]